MAFTTIKIWERQFRAEAKEDDYAVFREHLERLGLPDDPEMLIDGTVLIMQACESHWALDQRDPKEFSRFLDMQRYKPTDSVKSRLSYTFDLFGCAFGRVITEPDIHVLDLADLYSHPWDLFEIVGYHTIKISRIDWKELSGEEQQQIEEAVTYDLRFDYSDEELDIWFFPVEDPHYLEVEVNDVIDDDEDDE